MIIRVDCSFVSSGRNRRDKEVTLHCSESSVSVERESSPSDCKEGSVTRKTGNRACGRERPEYLQESTVVKKSICASVDVIRYRRGGHWSRECACPPYNVKRSSLRSELPVSLSLLGVSRKFKARGNFAMLLKVAVARTIHWDPAKRRERERKKS